MTELLQIDGSRGEGGGQILRTALTLSMVTGKPFRMTNIRANRKNPGLAAQHLGCVRAAACICGAEVEGARLKSTEITFNPGGVEPGDYRLDVGTAGSVALVLHALYLPLSLARGESQLILTGGTHVAWSPPYEFVASCWSPMLQRMGFDIKLRLEKAGYYPKGGGEVHIEIKPVPKIGTLYLTHRGSLKRIMGTAAVSNLPDEIAMRMTNQVDRRLRGRGLKAEYRLLRPPSIGKGTYFFLLAEYENTVAGYVGLGERGKRAEKVADEIINRFFSYHFSDGALTEHLADQLVLPLALASGESVFSTHRITQHLLTNIDTVKYFLPAKINVDGEPGGRGTVRIIL